MIKDKYDILFIGNFSYSLSKLEEKISSHFHDNISYLILTYRKLDIKSSTSYEEFLENNFSDIKNEPFENIVSFFTDTNFYLSAVSERLITNYYGLDGTLGNRKLNYDEIVFFIKSWVIFLADKIKNANIIFTGYADNIISILTYYIAKHYNKKCVAFHEISVINNETNYLVEGLYCKPVDDLITNKDKKNIVELEEFLLNFNPKQDLKQRVEKNKDTKRGLMGIVSPNIFDLNYLKFALFGYRTKNKKIFIYMNIDRPSIYEKFKANLSRLKNKLICTSFLKNLTFEFDKSIKYIYFPLQLSPEASTGTRAPFFMNQFYTIESISKSLPLGVKLIVKEHPLAVGMRSMSFYQSIMSMPNVVLAPIGMKGTELLDICEFSIGYGGTTLFESILKGKKLMLLCDFIYSDSKLIKRIESVHDIFNAIKDLLSMSIAAEEKIEEKEKMLNFFYQRGFPRFVDFEKNIAQNLEKLLKINNVD